MSDQFTETTTQGYGSRLLGSFGGMLVGFVLLIAGPVLLYWNEGRAVEAMAALDRGARTVIEVAPEPVDPAADGKLVHVSGAMSTKTPARDPMFSLSGDGLVRLRRTAEMYQWKEEQHSESHESVGGSKTTETTYTYRKEWASQAINSSHFKHPENHINPSMPVHSQTFDSTAARLGAYALGPKVIAQISDFAPLASDAAALPAGWRRDGDVLFRGTGSPGNPEIGDMRVSFEAVAAQPYSVVAGAASGTLSSFRDQNGYETVMARPGTVSADEMFREKKQEERILTWILRGAGFVAILVALLLIASPVSMLLAVIPLLEGIAEAGAFLIAFALALPLILVIIALAWLAHRPLIGVALLVAAVAAFFLVRQLHPRQSGSPAPARDRVTRAGRSLDRSPAASGFCDAVYRARRVG
jgi:hypothetical protein